MGHQQSKNKLKQSRVSVIYEFEKNVKNRTNNFYQNKNASSMSNYQKRIQSYKKFQDYDSQKIK